MKAKILLAVLLLPALLFSQSGYYSRTAFGFTSPGAMKFGLYGTDNPAVLSTLHAPDVLINWTNYNKSWDDSHRIGAYAAIPNFGFSAVTTSETGLTANEYNFSAGFGTDGSSFGIGYSWSRGDSALRNANRWTLGWLMRPNKLISAGLIANLSRDKKNEAVAELAFRPLQNEVLSVFGDYLLKKEYITDEAKWSAGVAVEAFPGIRVTGRYFGNKSMTAGMQFELGNMGLSSQSYYDKDQNYSHNSYGIRLGAYDRNIIQSFKQKESYYKLDLGTVDYRRYQLFDDKQTLASVLKNLNAAKNDPSVKGVYINMTSLEGNREIVWEIREKLKELKQSGKVIIIYFERVGINELHFASIADTIVMDPLGSVSMEGYLLGRSYLKGMLAKLGIGFDELRFFKYKSAVETYANDKMSPADREQRQAIVDDWYKLAKEDIVATGRLTGELFDSLINNKVVFLPEEAVKFRLVDKLKRWDVLEEEMKENKTAFVSASGLVPNKLPKDNSWGDKPKIAVIYALGECSMETGIAARTLIKDVKKACEDDNVKAIVLRVDSPGGDALASDYISEVLRKTKGKKPIIVSQGYVAASGGYWLSMYSDTIVAAPSTITGSIGVIGGFFYDAGFKSMLGLSTDHVKKGDHADMGFGIVLPLLNMPIPDRDFSKEERAKVETYIRTMYGEFVNKVADGRHRKPEEIGEIAQGRVWSGYAGKQNGLVDVLGGMETAVDIAGQKAGLEKGSYDIIQLPEAQLIDPGMFTPKLISAKSTLIDSPAMDNLRFRMKFNGKPLHMLPMDFDIQ